jgi:aminopeptidase YwaD
MAGHRKTLIGILFLLSAQVFSQNPFSFSDTAILARMKADVYALASDSMQGRNSGTEGERKAYEYLIRQFKEAGLSPMGTDSSWLQPFPYRVRTEDAGSRLSISGTKLTRFDDFGVVGFSATGQTSGVIVDVRSGLFLPDNGIDQYDGLEVTGKVVLIDLYVPGKWIRNDSTAALVKPEARARLAFTKGATGVLFHDPDSHWGLSFGNADRPDTMPGPVMYVTRNVVRDIRKASHPVAELETKLTLITFTYHNVVGYIDNHAPTTIILGAHYDHVGVGTHTGLVRNGADDNASGTVMITELARYYAASPDASSNFLVIAFSGEEEWLKGSYYFAAHPTTDLEKVSFMFNFDMVGRLGCQGNRVDAVCTATSPAWKTILKEASSGDFRVRKIPGAGEFSDHAPFYKKNLPIAYLTTGLHYDYHTSRDDAEKINYPGMIAVSRYARGIISEAEKQGKLPFTKVSDWNNARSMLYYIGEQLDYVLTVGFGEME